MTASTWPEEPILQRDLTTFGRNDVDLRRAVRRGELRTPIRGVYLPAAVPDSVETRAAAIARLIAPHHVVIDRTAAWILGVDVYEDVGRAEQSPLEFCALRGRHPTARGSVDGRTRDLARGDVTLIGGVPVTTPLRTALDLGCCLRRRDAFAALNELAGRYALTREEFRRSLGRYRRRRGVVQLRQLVDLVDPSIESPRESWLFLALVDAGLPAPEVQCWISIDGVPTFRLDFAYRSQRVCVEYDGVEAHQGREGYDEARRAWLRSNGWTVIVVRRGDFSGAALDAWVRRVAEALATPYTNRRW